MLTRGKPGVPRCAKKVIGYIVDHSLMLTPETRGTAGGRSYRCKGGCQLSLRWEPGERIRQLPISSLDQADTPRGRHAIGSLEQPRAYPNTRSHQSVSRGENGQGPIAVPHMLLEFTVCFCNLSVALTGIFTRVKLFL